VHIEEADLLTGGQAGVRADLLGQVVKEPLDGIVVVAPGIAEKEVQQPALPAALQHRSSPRGPMWKEADTTLGCPNGTAGTKSLAASISAPTQCDDVRDLT
jgi:hypothetical protein